MSLRLEDLQEVRESDLPTQAVHADELRGAIVGDRYQLLARLSQGALGTLYRGAHVELGRAVTIEMVDEDLHSSRLARATAEAAMTARLSHPHCGAVLDIGMHGTRTFVVREPLTGQSLEHVLHSERVSVQRAIEITRQVLAAHAHAHERDVVHGELSATNVIIEDKSGIGDHVKVIGFGATEATDAEPQRDLHACGALLSIMVGDQKLACLPVADVVRRAVTCSASDRIRSATEFAAALDAAEMQLARGAAHSLPPPIPSRTNASSTNAKGTTDAEPHRSRIRGALLATAIVTVLGGVAAIALPRKEREPAETAAATHSQPKTGGAETPAAPAADAVAAIVARAQDMLNHGDRSSAIELLVASRVTYPNDARLPRLAGTIYFDKLWWADGVKQLRAAFEIDPRLREDPEIAAMAVNGFITTPTYNWLLGRFVREDIGAAAMPNLERVAREHRNPTIRARAVAELRRMAVH